MAIKEFTGDQKSVYDGGLEQVPFVTADGTEVKTRISTSDGKGYDGFEYREARDPKYLVGIFTITDRPFQGVGGNGDPRKGIKVPGLNEVNRDGESRVDYLDSDKEEAMPFRYVTSFPHPMISEKPSDNTNELAFVESSGIAHVISLLSPDHARNGLTNLNTLIPASASFSEFNSPAKSGVFFDLIKIDKKTGKYTHATPSTKYAGDKERGIPPAYRPSLTALTDAYKRQAREDKELLAKARTLNITNKPELEMELFLNPDYVYAANRSGEQFDWNKISTARMIECKHCGGRKPLGRLFHQSEHGFMCIEPSKAAWEAVYSMGIKRKEDVPEQFRWWKEEPVKKNKLAEATE